MMSPWLLLVPLRRNDWRIEFSAAPSGFSICRCACLVKSKLATGFSLLWFSRFLKVKASGWTLASSAHARTQRRNRPLAASAPFVYFPPLL